MWVKKLSFGYVSMIRVRKYGNFNEKWKIKEILEYRIYIYIRARSRDVGTGTVQSTGTSTQLLCCLLWCFTGYLEPYGTRIWKFLIFTSHRDPFRAGWSWFHARGSATAINQRIQVDDCYQEHRKSYTWYVVCTPGCASFKIRAPNPLRPPLAESTYRTSTSHSI